ncbi:MAG TPA: hypothetical protein VN788_16915, partial [Verrucomicrobiae bacterium]|nr:hypothetical protein [Verrucomicrobiae bacterium]
RDFFSTILKNSSQSRRFHIVPSLSQYAVITELDAASAIWVAKIFRGLIASRSSNRNDADSNPAGAGKSRAKADCSHPVIAAYAQVTGALRYEAPVGFAEGSAACAAHRALSLAAKP